MMWTDFISTVLVVFESLLERKMELKQAAEQIEKAGEGVNQETVGYLIDLVSEVDADRDEVLQLLDFLRKSPTEQELRKFVTT